MSLATLFGKLQEHEMELQRLNQNEETDKRKRSIALKASSSMQEEEEEEEETDDEEDFSLFVKKFHKFVKNRRMERSHNFNNGKRSQEVSPTLKCPLSTLKTPFSPSSLPSLLLPLKRSSTLPKTPTPFLISTSSTPPNSWQLPLK